MLEARGVVKTFGTVNALQGADFIVDAGTVTALIGDNGAGKSTLVKVLSGVLPPTAARSCSTGEPVAFHSPLDAHRLGIETVYQDLALAPHLDAAANVFLGREIRRGSRVHEQAGDAPADDDSVQRPRGNDGAGSVGPGGLAVGGAAPVGRHRPLGAVGQAGDLLRRADRRPRCDPDPPRPRPHPPRPRPGTRRRAHHPHAARRPRGRRPCRGAALRATIGPLRPRRRDDRTARGGDHRSVHQRRTPGGAGRERADRSTIRATASAQRRRRTRRRGDVVAGARCRRPHRTRAGWRGRLGATALDLHAGRVRRRGPVLLDHSRRPLPHHEQPDPHGAERGGAHCRRLRGDVRADHRRRRPLRRLGGDPRRGRRRQDDHRRRGQRPRSTPSLGIAAGIAVGSARRRRSTASVSPT